MVGHGGSAGGHAGGGHGGGAGHHHQHHHHGTAASGAGASGPAESGEPIEADEHNRAQAWAAWLVVAIIVTAVNVALLVFQHHRQDDANKAQARQNAAEQRAEAHAYDMYTTGDGIVQDIMRRTPRGTSPRSVPFAEILRWERSLLPQYRMTPDKYSSTGMFNLSNTTTGATACVVVPDHVESSIQQEFVYEPGSCSSQSFIPQP